MRTLVHALGALLAVAGCYNPAPAPGAPCETSRDCPTSQRCVLNVCGGEDMPQDAAPDHDAPVDSAIPVDAPPDSLNIVTVVVGDDAAELRDTEIWDAYPTANFGTGDHYAIDGTENGMVWFDLTQIETSRTVTSATLTITVADAADEAGGTATIHRLREAWVETEATWVARATSQAWSLAGARSPSSDTTPVATFAPAAVDTAYDIVLPTSLVQAWVDDPAMNYGIIFMRGTSTEHVHLRSREATAGWAKLTIAYY